MQPKDLLREAKQWEQNLIEIRHHLHQNPETEFDLDDTVSYVKEQLQSMGLTPQQCGCAGVTVTLGQGPKTFLLRADMDALPIKEQAPVTFASTNGKMHACGHDMHTTMLLGAARLLKEHEKELCGRVKLSFQPAEEIFEGAKDMIASGLLQEPKVDAALMIHVSAAMPMQAGSVIVCQEGVSAPAADCFSIKIQGKGCHGSMPDKGIDPITIASHIVIALQEIHARELNLSDVVVLTFGSIRGGIADNVIPDTVELSGTIRTYEEETRDYVKQRLVEMSKSVAETFRGEAEVSFLRQCPTLLNDAHLSECATRYTKELLGESKAFCAKELIQPGSKPSKAGGSEDFAYISHEVPSIMLALAAGEPKNGYQYPQHHPKVMFEESILAAGSAVYAYNAMRWLEEHGK